MEQENKNAQRELIEKGAELLEQAWNTLQQADCFLGIGDEDGAPYVQLSNLQGHATRYTDLFDVERETDCAGAIELHHQHGGVDICAIK